jgi:hypothetical protein
VDTSDATMKSIQQRITERTADLLRWFAEKKRSSPKLYGFKEFCTTPMAKRALLSYLPGPLLVPVSQRDRTMFSNLGIAQYIPRALNELGYEVDIIAWDDEDWLPDRRYDLFIGHGGKNFERISHALPADVTQIYFSTGIYWREWNVREARRIYELAVRKGFVLPPDRAIRFSEEYANRRADGIICLGNRKTVQTYRQFPLVIGIHNAVYLYVRPKPETKDFLHGRRHFLFFSGEGNLHKGLDLLLEAFVGTDMDLHICQNIAPDFGHAYRYELTQCSNIHVYGHIDMRSEEFKRLTSLCNWIISATACEGQPGSILECMAYGLIPIIPAEANINLKQFGILLPENGIADMRKRILVAAGMDPMECRRRAMDAADEIREHYSPEKFNAAFQNAVKRIVDEKSHRRSI